MSVTTETRRQIVDIRREVEEALLSAGVRNGVTLVNCLHTTCSVVVTELAGEESDTLVGLMTSVISEDKAYRHNDLRWSDCERGNAAAHLRAGLLGPGVTIGVADGALTLAPSQSIVLAEWDGPRVRVLDVQIFGA